MIKIGDRFKHKETGNTVTVIEIVIQCRGQTEDIRVRWDSGYSYTPYGRKGSNIRLYYLKSRFLNMFERIE